MVGFSHLGTFESNRHNSRWLLLYMKTLSHLLLGSSLLGLVVGVSNIGNPEFSGVARALGAVFFILFFITRMFKFIGEEDAATNLNPATA
jgi:hypothetical protein